MHTKSKYPWLRHIDFLIVDLFAIIISFTVAFFVKFKGLWLIGKEQWVAEVWIRLVFLITAADVFFTFLLNSYSNILKRKYYMEIIQAMRLTIYNAISVALVLYIFKRGEDYSRTVFILTYIFYFIISLVMKYIWKKIILSGKLRISKAAKNSLFIIAYNNNIDMVLANINDEDSDSSFYNVIMDVI